MYKAKMEDVKRLIEWGKDDEVVSKLISKEMIQPRIERVAYYSAPSWNWAYEIGIAEIDGVLYELLTQFGSVKGGRQLWLPKYKLEELLKN